MAQNHFLAGVGTVLVFEGNNLIGVAKTLQDSGLNFSIAAEDIRGGASNALWGKYFHDSNLAITLTDAMFDINYVAANLGTNVQSGGLSIKEEQVEATGNKVTLTETPVATVGSLIGWYKKPADTEWKIGNIADKQMTVTGNVGTEPYCVKYFYQNENAKSILIKTQYVPRELHAVIINDLFSGDVNNQMTTARYGRLITDVPRLQLDGNMDLSLTASGAATMPLSGNALAVNPVDSCESDPYYGTMTQEIYGAKWQDDVIALAVENGDVELAQNATETLVVRAVFGGNMASQRKDNSNFTFAIEAKPTNTATGTTVGANTGVVTAKTTAGECVISVKLKGRDDLEPAYARVQVK